MGVLTLLWKYKAWVLLAVVLIAFGLTYTVMKIDNGLKESELKKKEALLEIVQRQNKILSQNAAALQKQDKRMKEIAATSDRIVSLMLAKPIPIEVREALNHESITLVNNCMAAYGNTGVLPAGCDAIKTSVPVSAAAKSVDGR